ncbi:MAG: hypothetical protein ABI895_33170 [Deltaproteobacteria bacterium]
MVTRLSSRAVRCVFAAMAVTAPASAQPAAQPAPSAEQATAPAASAAPAALPAPLPSAPVAPSPAQPSLLHTPVSTAVEGEPLELVVEYSHPEGLRQALLLYRAPSERQFHELPFRRSARAYSTTVSATEVRSGLEYLIELELASGERRSGFASRAAPFGVQVQLGKDDADERAAARRLNERRSLTSFQGEWVTFGKSGERAAAVPPFEPGMGLPVTVAPSARADDYYRLEASYAYRPLRFVNEFGVRLGLVRGASPRDVGDSGSPDVGLNYAAPWLRLRLDDVVYTTAHVVTGVTEVDFSLGAGLELTLGDPYGASLELGFENIEGFGSRFFTRLNILASDRVRVSPIIEATDMPNARNYGVRLLSELGWQVTPELGLALRGGYQARAAVSGGVSLGAAASLGF